MEKKFTHLNQSDLPRMVDISEKSTSNRIAEAEALINLGEDLGKILSHKGNTKKGPVIETAIIAGIQGAKKTSELIPLCHPIKILSINIKIKIIVDHAEIRAVVISKDQTGVEMEALTAVTIAALTFYDMCKSVNKSLKIESIKLLKKSGGKSGDYYYKKK